MRKLSIITGLFIFLYSLLSNNPSILIRLSNSFFILGLIYFSIALFFHVRNVGFFKLISYHNYVRKQTNLIQSGSMDKFSNNTDYKLKKLHEFVEEKYKFQWDNGIFYKFSLPLIAISLFFAFIST